MAERKLPDTQRLVTLREQGMTLQQIADWWFEKSNIRVTPQAISTALYRAGKTDPQVRYKNTIPWRVKAVHSQDGRVRVLRWLARRLAGLPLSADQEQRVDSMLSKLAAKGAVIVYLPESGFHTVDKTQAIEGFGGRQPDPNVPVVILPGDELRV